MSNNRLLVYFNIYANTMISFLYLQMTKIILKTHTHSANNAKVNFREKEKKVLDQILGQGKYDARIRPSGINGTGKFRSIRQTF